MAPRTIPTALRTPTVDYFALALLLAEGQSGDANARWPEFVDNLSRITDAFAHVCVSASSKRLSAQRYLLV